MKSIFNNIMVCFIVIVLLLSFETKVYSQTCTPEGNWHGAIESRGKAIRIGIHIEINNGAFAGYFNSPDQSQEHFPFDKISFLNDTLKAICKKIKVVYTAIIVGKCDSLKGEWSQGANIPVKMWRVDSLPEMLRPQEPIPPFPYMSEDVVFENKKAGFSLAGTLTYPSGDGPFPAVIMITGSGAQNRNEELLGHKPFMVIADYLTRSGIAVLRYDDRGIGGSGGDFSKSTSYDFATDVQAAFDFLKTHPKINPANIGLVGHSEGGMIAPIVAAKNKNVAFIILLAGPGTTGKQILISQSELIGRADSIPEEEIQDNLKIGRLAYEIIEKEKNPDKIAEQIREMVNKETADLTAEQKAEAGLTDVNISIMIITITSDWFTTFVRFDPSPWLKKVSCPVLALNGEKDLQVPCKENLTAIENALKSGKCKNYTVKEFQGLNHLFQHCTTGSPSEYVNISETISPEVLKIIADWITNLSKK